MKDRPQIVLDSVLRLLKPAARLLLACGVTYPAFAAALKRVFLQAAQEELQSRQMPVTDSALTLLSGVHRRDVRTLLRGEQTPTKAAVKGQRSHHPLDVGCAVSPGARPQPDACPGQ